jgi:sugar fermentation stimulation protein A
MLMAAGGCRAVIFYCVQRDDCQEVRPAESIDPYYAEMLREAVAAGVEALAYKAAVTVEGIELRQRLPVVL